LRTRGDIIVSIFGYLLFVAMAIGVIAAVVMSA
jgi:hypothetical protein